MSSGKSIIGRLVAGLTTCVVAVVGTSHFLSDDMPERGSEAMVREYQLPETYEEHGAQQQWFATDDGQIAYTDHGPLSSGSSSSTDYTLVLIHGVPTSSWMYRKLIPKLQHKLRVVSVDLLGFGGSDKPEQPMSLYDADKQAQRVAALATHLQLDNYSILVHDMGGLVGWELLRQQAPIQDLVILNSIVRAEGFNNPTFEKGSFSKMMTMTYSNDLTSSVMLRRTFEAMGMDTSYKLSEAECRGYVMPIADGSDNALYAFFTGLNQNLFDRLESNAEAMAGFSGRSIVLWGAKDTILTTQQIPFLQQHLRIDDKDIHIFEQHNHFLAEENPDVIAARILELVPE